MKKRIVSFALALVMLISMIPAVAAGNETFDFNKTYSNILEAGFDPAEITKDFPETVEMIYDAETETLKMEDIGAESAGAYYGNIEMTLEDGYWTAQISPEEHEGHYHVYYSSGWMAVYTSDGGFDNVEVYQDGSSITVGSDNLSICYQTDTHYVTDTYDRETGELETQNVWPLDTESDYCDVFYNPDGTIFSAHAYVNGEPYLYENGAWDPVPSKFITEEEMKAACPFIAPVDTSEGDSSGSASITTPSLIVNDDTDLQRAVPNEVYDDYSVTQYVLTADQMTDAQGKTITELQYWYVWQSEDTSRDIAVYLQPYADEYVTAFVSVSADTKVFDGTVSYCTGEEEVLSIPLDTEYPYESGNVLVTVIDKTGTGIRGTLEYYGDTGNNVVSAAHSRDNYPYSADNISMVSANGNTFRPKTGIVLTASKVIKELVLNDGEVANRDIPFSTAFKYSAAQYVLTADQLTDAQGGCITDLQYWYRTTSAIGRTIEIYLEPYADEKVEAFVDVSPNTKVFEGYVIFASGDKNILTVPLDTEYSYESGNVLVTVIDKTGSYAFDGEVFAYGVRASEEVNAYDWNNSLTYDAEELSNETITTRNSSFLPKTGIVYEKPQPPVTLATVDGAQMRIRGPQGLRFTSSITKGVDFDKVTEYGTILIPTEDMTDVSELTIGATLNGREVAKVEAINKYAEDEESVTFTAVIIDIKEKNYARSYTARAYAIWEDGSVVYGDTYASRSIYQIAQAILADENASAEEKAAAQEIVDVVDGANKDNDLSEPWGPEVTE